MASKSLDVLVLSLRRACESVQVNLTFVIISSLLGLLITVLYLFDFNLSQTDSSLPTPVGCRKLGLQGHSNLSDQYSKKHAQGDSSISTSWTVKALFIYPLKSCAPVEIDQSEIVRTGFNYDRQFAFGQYHTHTSSDGKVEGEWRFISQRSFPLLARVEIEIWVPNPSDPQYEKGEWKDSDGCLVIRFPSSQKSGYKGLRDYARVIEANWCGKKPVVEFRVPFSPSKSRINEKGYTKEVFRIWRDNALALNMGSEIDAVVLAKLKSTLGIANPVSLFRANMDTETCREVHKNAPKKEDVGFQPIISMQDSYPLHILNLASVHNVSNKLPPSHRPLSALRFRANIYITGPPPFDEDDWAKIRIGRTLSHVSCRTTRCKLPNVDPDTGIQDRNEPLTTMRSYRVIDKGNKSPCLGMNVTPLEDGVVRVGDVVELLETGEHFFLGGKGSKVMG